MTKVTLDLPLAMKENIIKPITVETNNLVANVSYVNHITDNPNITANGNVTKLYDKEGQITSSMWIIEFNKYINCEETIKIDSDYYISVLDEAICSIINTVINNYRLVTKEYWIKNIYPVMIGNKTITYLAEGTSFRHIPYLDNSTYKISAIKEKAELPNSMFTDAIPLYELLLMDSQSYLLSGDFRESVLSLNSALENYIYTFVCPLIVKISGNKLDKHFYLKISDYNHFVFKDYMSEEYYQIALKQGLIKEEGMSTFKIIKILYDHCDKLSSLISKRQMNKLLDNIRKNRNDFIHGNKVTISTSYREVYGQIQAFMKFKEIISNLINII